MNKREAIQAINKHGILLVYPIKNARDPLSLWQIRHPRKKMVWEWDDGGDASVPNLWHLRAELSSSRRVVYSKWFRGRATFFSLNTFQSLLGLSLQIHSDHSLSREAREILEILNESSPRSIRVLKKETGLVGRAFEPIFMKAMKELWLRFLIVGYGEIDDGAFPSLAIGATQALFEDIYLKAKANVSPLSQERARRQLESSPALKKFANQGKLFKN